MPERPSLIIEPPHTLTPCDAVAAIILVDGGYLLQHRDPKPNIFYPDHWGFFGGGIEPGESETDALVRELHEELGLKIVPGQARRFTCLTFDFAFAGGPSSMVRAFYELEVTEKLLSELTLGEGRSMRVLSAEEALDTAIRLAPYDGFALWMHANADRITF